MNDEKDMELVYLVSLLLAGLVLLGGISYLGYRTGQLGERKVWEAEFKIQVERSYYDGLKDGYKKGYNDCDMGEDEDGRY